MRQVYLVSAQEPLVRFISILETPTEPPTAPSNTLDVAYSFRFAIKHSG